MTHPNWGLWVAAVFVLPVSSPVYFKRQPFLGRFLALNGAFSFYLSDVFVARQRFVQPAFLNRLIGLPLYYLGQFQIAYTVGLIG